LACYQNFRIYVWPTEREYLLTRLGEAELKDI